MSPGDTYTRVAESAGYVECSRCRARQVLTADRQPTMIAELVRAFTAAHAHGAVTTVTPHVEATRAVVRRRCSRCGSTNHNARVCALPAGVIGLPECGWCGALATTTDEDGDPSCAQHAREFVRPEAVR